MRALRHELIGHVQALPLHFSVKGWSFSEKVILGLIGALLFYSTFILFWSFGQPLLEAHAFRQTQTALSTYWMLEGGPLVAYETPVRGAPWTIPFEFPIYQYSAAFLTFFGLSVEDAGRTAAFLYFVGCIWPLTIVTKNLGFGRFGTLALVLLFLASPINIYWGRAFMIESCSVFFGLLFLAFLLKASRDRNHFFLFLSFVAATLCVLAKSTTLPAFSLIGGFWFLYLAYQKLIEGAAAVPLYFLGLVVVALFLPYVVGLAWVSYADALKEQSILGRGLTSEALHKWNYGEFGLRFSEKLWHQTLPLRTFPDILGYASILGLGFLLAALASWRFFLFALLSLIAFIVPMMIFTNIHVHHNYYQAANSVFLLAAVACGLKAIESIGERGIATFALVAIAMSQTAFFHARYFESIRNPDDFLVAWKDIGIAANEILPQDVGIYFFEYSWSSVIPFYSQRKSVALTNIRGERLRTAFNDPQQFLGDLPLGGVVVCVPQPEEVQAYLRDREILAERGRCQLFGPLS